MASPGEAATVSLCPTADGTTQVEISHHAARAGCSSRSIAAEAADVEWATALPRLPRDDEEVVVVTSSGGARRVELRPIASAAAPLPALPIGVPLLLQLKPRPFGVEERVAVANRDSTLTVRCTGGTRIAGLVLDPEGARLPRQAAYRAIAAHHGDDGFRLAVARTGTDAGLGQRLDGPEGRTPISTGAIEGPVQFVLLCPDNAAELVLSDLRLEPAREPINAMSSAWAWQPAQWRNAPAKLFDAAAARGIERLHISLDIGSSGVRHADALGRFIRMARAIRIAVDVVEGDPRMVHPAGRTRAVMRARAIARYQRSVPPDARLAGIQYDIEPYVLPEFSSDRAAMLDAWSRTIAELAAAAGQKLDIVVPFWIADRPDGEAALDRVAAHVRQLTVMAYRTDAAQAGIAAEPLLAWGVVRNIPVRIALEMGRLEDEVEVRYRRGEGTLGLLPIGDGAALIKLRDNQRHREATPLTAIDTMRIAAGRLSFQGNAKDMFTAADALRPMLSAWPSFAGFAFHGLF